AAAARVPRLRDRSERFAVFMDLRRVRERAGRLLERRLWPREQADLHLLAGCLNALMGVAARRLGYPDAAGELIRAGWAHASAAGHRPLLAHLRFQQASGQYWCGNPAASRDLALSGLEDQPHGKGGARLPLQS